MRGLRFQSSCGSCKLCRFPAPSAISSHVIDVRLRIVPKRPYSSKPSSYLHGMHTRRAQDLGQHAIAHPVFACHWHGVFANLVQPESRSHATPTWACWRKDNFNSPKHHVCQLPVILYRAVYSGPTYNNDGHGSQRYPNRFFPEVLPANVPVLPSRFLTITLEAPPKPTDQSPTLQFSAKTSPYEQALHGLNPHSPKA